MVSGNNDTSVSMLCFLFLPKMNWDTLSLLLGLYLKKGGETGYNIWS